MARWYHLARRHLLVRWYHLARLMPLVGSVGSVDRSDRHALVGWN